MKFEVVAYQDNNNLAICLLDARYEELYVTVTTNFEKLEPYTAYVKVDKSMIQFLMKNEIGVQIGLIKRSGFCTYSLFQFDPQKLLEIDPMSRYP